MQSEFLKSLIQLLAQHGGTFTCPLSELQPLGLELSLQNISSDNAATLTLRLGARIYYVPAKATQPQEATEPCPTTPPAESIPTSSTSLPPTGQTKPSAILTEVAAVNTLNNRIPDSQFPELPNDSSLRSHTPKTKSDLDLYLLEQNKATRRTANAKRQATKLRNATREYPWENRKPQ